MAQIPASVVSPGAIRSAYGTAGAAPGGPAPAAAGGPPGTSFAQLLGQAAEDAARTVRAADQTIQAGLQGKASTQAIVEATMSMESTVKLTVAVRDKLVEAYQQIMQMQI